MDQHSNSHPSGLPTREEAAKQPPKKPTVVKDKMYKEMWFPTQIYFWDHPTAKETNKRIKKNVDKWHERDEKGIVRSNSLGWHSAVDMHHRNEYNHFTKWLLEKVEEVYRDNSMHKNYSPFCDNMWANINKRYSHNRNHTHPGCLWSGVYYIQAPKDSGRIWFTDPRGEAHMLVPRYENQRSSNTWREVFYEPIAGRLIIFPSWLMHEVEPNLNKEYEDENDTRGWRYSISFNFGQRLTPGAEAPKEAKGHSSGGVINIQDLKD